MYLITSAALIASELQSEFGPLPPSFLPVGNQRLFHHQLRLIPPGKRILMTLPEDFIPGPYDRQVLMAAGVELLYLPSHLTLGESIVYALNLVEFNPTEPLFILHGDTLFKELPQATDLLGLSTVEDNYDWAEYDQHSGLLQRFQADQAPKSDLISNGFFSFSAPKTLIRHITQAKWDFISGLNGYIQELGLAPFLLQDWYDFGHSHTYYQSKSRMTTQRAFNAMQITGQVVCKTSHKKFKLAAEANWYQTLPGPMHVYIPQLLQSQESEQQFSYSIEYLHLTALNELYVFSQLPAFAWKKILRACCQFLHAAKTYQAPAQATLQALFAGKTRQRLQEFHQSAPFDTNKPLIINGVEQPSLQALAALSLAYLPADNHSMNLLHGDFCFSNILYDFRTCNIKVIDPRGIDANNHRCIYGNSLYDIAKLAHSVIGLYDAIIAGYFQAELQQPQQLTFNLAVTPRRQEIMRLFTDMMYSQFNVTESQLYAMQIQLFISMLPLHSDRPDRQLAFIGNAYRLFDELKQQIGY
ncbi:capsular biosynthesis protein [Shewanella sp. NFH-SH190041]|uniref:capsular biosynthesis protein n=1 Tax=Shewanella sp. NFH-SH190041 TaxID=2950245 RepID=UPI0021C3B36D|nr:capsular biosynthesis protein [Shewanella sp. NFH-SH190041]